jgi:hypothetical protein
VEITQHALQVITPHSAKSLNPGAGRIIRSCLWGLWTRPTFRQKQIAQRWSVLGVKDGDKPRRLFQTIIGSSKAFRSRFPNVKKEKTKMSWQVFQAVAVLNSVAIGWLAAARKIHAPRFSDQD